MRVFARLALLGAIAATAGACSKVQARTPGPGPALDPPPAPAPLIVPSRLPDPTPVEQPPATQVELADPPGRTDPPARPPRTAPPPPPPPADPQVLRTGGNPADMERLTRIQLQVAQRNIGAVKRGELSADGKNQYDEVLRFIRSAEEALKVKNYILARQLADKAALLASLLVKGGFATAP